MKTIQLTLVTALLLVSTSIGQNEVTPYEPKISLFQSVEMIGEFLRTNAKQDYSDKYLHSVTHHYSQGHPRKGACWHYSFASKRPTRGGNLSIYHFMDGQIIEFHHGP